MIDFQITHTTKKLRNTTRSSKHYGELDGKLTLSSLSQPALEELFMNIQLKDPKNSIYLEVKLKHL